MAQYKTIKALISAGLLLASPLLTSASAKTVNAYILAGQSLAIGVESSAYRHVQADNVIRLYPELSIADNAEEDLTSQEFPPGNSSIPRWLQTLKREPLDLAPILFTGTLRSGPEIALGRQLHQKYGKAHSTTILKFGVGGSSLERHWTNSNTVDYSDRLIMFLSQVRRSIENDGNTMVIRGFVWIQGPGDVDRQLDADRYLGNLRRLVIKVREFADNPKLPIVVSRTYIDLSKLSEKDRARRAKPLATVRNAQKAFATEDACTALTNEDDLKRISDGIHQPSSEDFVVGSRAFMGIERVKARPACKSL